jgi:transcriptional regulator with GAF, ATPase, and Fis domain
MKRKHVLRALETSGWRIEGPEGAAALLGMKPSTLRFRMKKLEISRGDSSAPPASPSP